RPPRRPLASHARSAVRWGSLRSSSIALTYRPQRSGRVATMAATRSSSGGGRSAGAKGRGCGARGAEAARCRAQLKGEGDALGVAAVEEQDGIDGREEGGGARRRSSPERSVSRGLAV